MITNKKTNYSFGSHIRQIRLQRNIGQRELAEKSAAQEGIEGSSIKEKTQSENLTNKELSNVDSLKDQKKDISLEQNIERA